MKNILIIYVLRFQPREITLASGRKLTYMYDSQGDLERMMLPRGNVVTVWRGEERGLTRLGMVLPGHQQPWVTSWSSAGQLMGVHPPSDEGVTLYRRDGAGRIEKVVAGDRLSEYEYDETTGDMISVSHATDAVHIKTSLHYNKERLHHNPATVCILFSSPSFVISRLGY